MPHFLAACAKGLTSAKDPLLAIQAGQTIALKSEESTNLINRIYRGLRIKHIDRAIKELSKAADESYTLFIGTLDALNDNIITEALREGESVEALAHAIYSCEESANFLRQQYLRIFLPCGDWFIFGRTEVSNELINILHDGICLIDTDWLFNAVSDVVTSEDEKNVEDNPLDLDGWEEVEAFHYLEGMECTKYTDACRLDWERKANWMGGQGREVLRSAVVVTDEGCKFFVHKESTANAKGKSQKSGLLIHTLASDVCQLETELKCPRRIAWKLMVSWVRLAPYNEYEGFVRDLVFQAFRATSRFRSSLVRQIRELHDSVAQKTSLGKGDKRLIGTKQELFQKLPRDVELQNSFSPERSIFENAMKDCNDENAAMDSFGESICDPDLDYVDTNLRIVTKLIAKAKGSDLNEGMNDVDCRFDALSVAVLRCFRGTKVNKGLISNKHKARYFFQEKDGGGTGDTRRALTTPFSNLILYAASDYAEVKESQQVQSLQMFDDSLANWMALRASMEYDMRERDFARDRQSYRIACELLDESVARFLQSITPRFHGFHRDLPDSITVSELAELADEMQELLGVSKPWLVRELVSRLVQRGCYVDDLSGPGSSYLRFEQLCWRTSEGEARLEGRKTLVCDSKINLRGAAIAIEEDGLVFLVECENTELFPFLSNRERVQATNAELARRWIKLGKYNSIEVVRDRADDGRMARRAYKVLNMVGVSLEAIGNCLV